MTDPAGGAAGAAAGASIGGDVVINVDYASPKETLLDDGTFLASAPPGTPGADALAAGMAARYVALKGGLPGLDPYRNPDAKKSLVDQILGLMNGREDYRAAVEQQVERILGQEGRIVIAGIDGLLPDPTQINQDTRADPVMMFNGELCHDVDDLCIDGAGIDFAFGRHYRNQALFFGPLGANWNHDYNIHLLENEEQLSLVTADLRRQTYSRHARYGEDRFTWYVPPDGEHAVFIPAGDSFVQRMPDGVRHIFERDPVWSGAHRLLRTEDRHGNYLRFTYGDGLLLSVAINRPDRVVRFTYDARGLLIAVTDHTGRTWRYDYDDWYDLVSFTTPATDRYPAGLTVRYEYSSATRIGSLQHNLTRITDACGRVYLENEYGNVIESIDFNRVLRQRQGGGEALLTYDAVIPVDEFHYDDALRPVIQTNFVDRNGHRVHFIYNRFGNLLLKEEMTGTSGGERLLRSHHRYNRDGALVGTFTSEGVLTQYHYGRTQYCRTHQIQDADVATHEQLTIEDRLGFGRLLAVVQRGSTFSLASLNFTAGLWGDIFPDPLGELQPEDIVTKFTHEQDYGQPLTVSDPRYTERADPEFQESERYRETLTRYEYTGPVVDPYRLLARVVRPGGVVEQFTDYDPRGRVLRQTSPAGTITEFAYYSEGDDVREGHLRSQVVDREGLAITTLYDVDALGRVIAVHHPRSVGAPEGHFVTRYEFNALNQVVRVIGSPPFNHEVRRFYDEAGMLEREEREAEIHTYQHDEQLNLIEETAGGRNRDPHLATRHLYDGADRRVLTILPAGNRIRYTYDEHDQLTGVTAGAETSDAATARTQYDRDGRKRRTVSRRGFATDFTLDAFGRVIEILDARGNRTRQTYDKAGNLVLVRVFERREDGSSVLLARTEFGFDDLGHQIRASHNLFPSPMPAEDLETSFLELPGPGRLVSTETEHDADGRVLRVIDSQGRERSCEYDAAGRMIADVDAAGNRTELTYDPHGNVVRCDVREPVLIGQETGEQVFSQTSTYDELDRLSSTTDSLGNTTTYEYDRQDNLVRQTDPLGNVRRCNFDAYGRLTTETRELTETGLGGGMPLQAAAVQREYDGNGNLFAVIDALGRRTSHVFDALDRRRAVVYPDGSRIDYEYDADDHIIARSDNNRLVRRYVIDELGRSIRVTVDRSNVPDDVLVEGSDSESREYDALGRVRREENDFAVYTISRDSLGRPVRETVAFRTPDAPFDGTLDLLRELDDAGAVTGLVLPGGRTLRYQRNALGQIVRIEDLALGDGYPGSPDTPESREIASYEYAGRRRSLARLANRRQSAWTYDGSSRQIEVRHGPAGAAPFLTVQQLFDAAGNIRLRNHTTQQTESSVFCYDSLYQLTSHRTRDEAVPFDAGTFGPATTPAPEPLRNVQNAIDLEIGSLAQVPDEIIWSYDIAGNRQRERRADGQMVAYIVNDLDQYAQVGEESRAYDRNGNLVNDGVRRYRYDSLNRLTRVVDLASGSDVVRFLHDARGRRILELAGGAATHLFYDNLNLTAVYRDGVNVAQYVHEDAVDRPVQVAADGDEIYFHSDLGGSVSALTDSAGDVAALFTYEEFGGSSDLWVNTRFRFAGRQQDPALGTYDLRARQYDPATGRFQQRDPIDSIVGTNLYAYAGNNPLTFHDPLGTERQPIAAPAPRTSALEDVRGFLVSAAGSDPYAQTNAGVAGAWITMNAEPFVALGDALAIGGLALSGQGLGTLRRYKPASDLAAVYLNAEEGGASNTELAWQMGGNVGGILATTFTLGLVNVPSAVEQLTSGASTPAERGSAAFELALIAGGARSLGERAYRWITAPPAADLIPASHLFVARIRGPKIGTGATGFGSASLPKWQRLRARYLRWEHPRLRIRRLLLGIGLVRSHVDSGAMLRPGDPGLIRWEDERLNNERSKIERQNAGARRARSQSLGLDPQDPLNPLFVRPP